MYFEILEYQEDEVETYVAAIGGETPDNLHSYSIWWTWTKHNDHSCMDEGNWGTFIKEVRFPNTPLYKKLKGTK